MIIVKRFYFAALLFLICTGATAQQNIKKDSSGTQKSDKKLMLAAVSTVDSIILRWAPVDPVDWKLASQQGYILERTTLDANNKVITRFEKLTPTPIKAWSKEMFIANVSKDKKEDKFSAVAAQALYGATFKPAAQKEEVALDEFNLLMKQHNEDEMRHSFALFAADVDVKASVALGLRYVDKKVEKDKKYIYRLYAVPKKGLLEMDTALFVIAPKDVITLNRVTFVQAETHNKAVFLEWPKNVQENNYTAFFIERSADGGKTFKQINAEPFTNINGSAEQIKNTVVVFSDTLPELYKKYVYRVRGVNSFAQYSPYSLPVEVMAKDDKAPPPPIINKTVKLSNAIYKISWIDSASSGDVKGYNVRRSRKLDSNFVALNKTLLPVTTRQYVDSTAKPGLSYYYSVTVVDTAGNSSSSLPDYVFTYDTIPPAAPVALAGKIDTGGTVTLKWALAKEEDIKGYRVFKANAADHEFTAVSKDIIQDTTFTDTIVLKTLTRDIYYKVMAVDNNLNNSGYSTALQLIKPDVVPPVPAVFVNYVTSDTSIQLFWNPSSSTDLNKQHLYRKTGTSGWLQLALLDKTTASYNDTAVQKLTLYTYLLISEDSAGLKSDSSFPISAKTFFNAASGAGKITAEYMADSLAVKIGWQLPVNTSATNIVLYRSVNGGGMVMYQNIPAGKQGYIDRHVAAGNTYGYSFKPIYAANREGGLSNTATVTP
jgi:fibronectin type 3 domain-containing protein